MGNRKSRRCYTCGSLFQGSTCPHCECAVDCRDMDMRLVDYARLLLLLLREVVRLAERRLAPRRGLPHSGCVPWQPPEKRAKHGLTPQRT